MKSFIGFWRSAFIIYFLPALDPLRVPAAAVGPEISHFSLGNGKSGIRLTPSPAVQAYNIWSSPALGLPFAEDNSGVWNGFEWSGAAPAGSAFFQVRAQQIPPDALYSTTLLNRIAYGPTPDELDRVSSLGAEGYLEEQIAPEKIFEDLSLEIDEPAPPVPIREADGWTKLVVSGVATSANPNFYIYLLDDGSAYVDDVRLVAGEVEDLAKPNLIRNGDFESALAGSWVPTENFTNSVLSTTVKHSGASSLWVKASDDGSGGGNSIVQTTQGIANGATYTLSFWYRTSSDNLVPVLRLSGASADAPETLTSQKPPYKTAWGKLSNGYGSITDLRRWHLLHGVRSQRQLLEILRQFLENHFVTQYSKTSDFLDAYYDDGANSRAAAQIELRENLKWRSSLLKPTVTFHELLKISAESPAMIIYLDTVNSRGNATRNASGQVTRRNIANENYARELCELFCFGVDHGYDQEDIVEISRVFTGWTVGYKRRANDGNPFAANLRDDPIIHPPNLGIQDFSLYWSIHYREGRHDERTKYCFYGPIQRDAQQNVTSWGQPKVVPARFGAPWAGRSYGLRITGSATTNSIQEGYQIIEHMADQPFTQEYLSVKLCRLFLHDGFRHGYDFTDGEVTPEERLVHDCMLAWENPPGGGPKGQLRPILRVILTSDLFRHHSGSLQKVKTPLEFALSTTRALRARKPDGTFTADTRGESDVTELLNDAGRMRLFDRGDPDGYPEEAPAWISAGTLTERLQFIERSLTKTSAGTSRSAPNLDPLALLKLKKPQAVRDAPAIVDYFLGILYPAEGQANLQGYRQAAIEFLNTNASGSSSPFDVLQTTSTEYENRLRAMVAFLMTTQRFQEQ